MYKIAVDGSFDVKNNIAYGGVCIINPVGISTIQRRHLIVCRTERFLSSRNVYGELSAMMFAYTLMESILKHSPDETFEVVYDYEGIEKWLTGAWKTNKELTSKYKQFCLNKGIRNITFIHQKSHAAGITENICLNSEADQIAGLVVQPDNIEESIL